MKILGTDYLVFKPNMKVVGKLMLESLKEKEILLALSYRYFCIPHAIAVKFNIPLIIWGNLQLNTQDIMILMKIIFRNKTKRPLIDILI